MTEQIIKRGILQSFDNTTYTATVLILEATNYVLTGVPIATAVDGTSALTGASCAVLFLDEQNPLDAVVIAVYGLAPSPAPGRVTFVTPYQQLSSVTISAGSTNTYTLNGSSSGLPGGILAALCRAYFSSTTIGAWVGLAPHGSSVSDFWVLGNQTLSGQSINGNAILPVDSEGRIDIQANSGNCIINLYTYGYVN